MQNKSVAWIVSSLALRKGVWVSPSHEPLGRHALDAVTREAFQGSALDALLIAKVDLVS